MASKERAELIEEVKELILDGNLYSRTLQETSERILSTILAALQEPTGEMIDATGSYYIEDKNRDLVVWNSMLKASPLGEQSE